MSEQVHPYVIIGIIRTAHYCKHSVAAEVELRVKRREEAYATTATRTARTQSQGEMFARLLTADKEALAELQALKEQFASCRGEAGALPVFRDKDAVCEVEIAAWAERLRDDVDRAAWWFRFGPGGTHHDPELYLGDENAGVP